MLFQWYLFVFLIILYVFAKAANQQYRVYVAGEYEIRYKWFTALAVVAVLTYVAATRHPNFIDTRSYYSHFMREAGTWESIVNIYNGNGKDKAFYIYTAILKRMKFMTCRFQNMLHAFTSVIIRITRHRL